MLIKRKMCVARIRTQNLHVFSFVRSLTGHSREREKNEGTWYFFSLSDSKFFGPRPKARKAAWLLSYILFLSELTPNILYNGRLSWSLEWSRIEPRNFQSKARYANHNTTTASATSHLKFSESKDLKAILEIHNFFGAIEQKTIRSSEQVLWVIFVRGFKPEILALALLQAWYHPRQHRKGFFIYECTEIKQLDVWEIHSFFPTIHGEKNIWKKLQFN